MDERRKPLAVSNPLLAKESALLPEPSVESLTFEHLSINLPSIAVNSLDAVSRLAVEDEVPDIPDLEDMPDLPDVDENEIPEIPN